VVYNSSMAKIYIFKCLQVECFNSLMFWWIYVRIGIIYVRRENFLVGD
jgi:hypothetical protein